MFDLYYGLENKNILKKIVEYLELDLPENNIWPQAPCYIVWDKESHSMPKYTTI